MGGAVVHGVVGWSGWGCGMRVVVVGVGSCGLDGTWGCCGCGIDMGLD